MEGERLHMLCELARLIERSAATLQRWDRLSTLHAFRPPTNQRYYTHTQCLQYRGLVSQEGGQTHAARPENPA